MKIQVENLRFSYGWKQVLNIASSNFEQGKVYGIVGANGAGKTTFFKALTNIVTNYRGKVLIDGHDVKTNPSILAKVGIVLDDMELYKEQTGLFNLRYFGRLRGNFDEEKALALAKELDIYDCLDERVKNYSLGMNKKLILLIAVINDAEILIFDEPFRGLDKKSVEWFKQYLINLKNNKRLILISSHIQEDIETLSNEVMIIQKGSFGNTFNLSDEGQTFIYKIEVNNQEAFTKLLEKKQIAFSLHGKNVRFEADEGTYRELFREAVADHVEFLQIKKSSKFVEYIE